MRKQLVILALAGTVGIAGGTLLSPGLASAETTASPVASRLTALKDALKGLVSDDTITQAQADKVAATLAEKLPVRGPGGRHGGGAHLSPEATAEAAGVTVAELRAGRQAGKSLTQIAAAKGVSKQTLVDRLVAAKKTELAAAVAAGRLTQAQSDAVSEDLVARTTVQVDRTGGPGDGPRGHGGGPDGDHDGDGPDDAPSTTTPAPQAS